MSDQEGPKGELTLRTLAMPADVNVSGDIFGGWVLSQMDIAAGIIAGQHAQGRVTTIAVDAMKFIRPVQVGDVLCVQAHGISFEDFYDEEALTDRVLSQLM